MHPARSHATRGSGDAEGGNSITVFNLGNEKDVLPSLPSQNAAHTDFTTDFTVRLCLQKWGEKRGKERPGAFWTLPSAISPRSFPIVPEPSHAAPPKGITGSGTG